MKHQHRSIPLLALMVSLALPVVAGGPIVFVLFVMAAPLLLLLIVSAWAVVNGAPQGGYRRRGTGHGPRE